MDNMGKTIRFFWRQMEIQLRVRALTGSILTMLLIQPIIFSGIAFFMARIAGADTADLVYVIIGGGLVGLWAQVLFISLYDITGDRREGTLELFVGSPTSLGMVLSARILTNVLSGALSLVGSFLLIFVFFPLSLPLRSFPALAFSLLIILFSFWCLGILLANFHAWSRMASTIYGFFEMPIVVLSGFMFPISFLPNWLQTVTVILPTRWAVAALNESLIGQPDISTIWQSWLYALALSLFYLFLGLRLARRVHDQIRISGELSSI
jgi:ABC-2 type transport system permease protein